MTQNARWSVLAALLAAVTTAAPLDSLAQVPGPERIEVVRTDGGPHVLLAGVGVGTAYAHALERLGGGGAVNAFFGGGPIVKTGEIDGVRCSLLVLMDETERVRDLYLECDGSRVALRRLADRFRAALAAIPGGEDARGSWFGEEDLVASIAIGPVDEDGWWGRTFGPRQLRVRIRR